MGEKYLGLLVKAQISNRPNINDLKGECMNLVDFCHYNKGDSCDSLSGFLYAKPLWTGGKDLLLKSMGKK